MDVTTAGLRKAETRTLPVRLLITLAMAVKIEALGLRQPTESGKIKSQRVGLGSLQEFSSFHVSFPAIPWYSLLELLICL